MRRPAAPSVSPYPRPFQAARGRLYPSETGGGQQGTGAPWKRSIHGGVSGQGNHLGRTDPHSTDGKTVSEVSKTSKPTSSL